VTPWGRIEPWDESPSLDWYVAADDRWHVPRNEAAVRQSRVDGTPVVETRVRVPGGDVVQTTYSCADGGGFTVIEIDNESSMPVAIAFDRRDVSTERPIVDMAIEGIDLPAGSFVMPLGHRARIRVALSHASQGPGAIPALPAASQVARGWVALAHRASRFVLPEGERGAALARRVVSERCELALRGPAGPTGDRAAFVLGAGELVRLGEAAAGAMVDDVAVAVEAIAPDEGWEARAALAAAARLLAAAGEARAVRDVERIILGRPELPPPQAAPEGVFLVPWLESQFAVGGALLPMGMPATWHGESIEAHGIPTGASSSISLALRWHGTRPAVLWEQSGEPMELTAPALAPAWSSRERSGEVLWPAPG
jgi:hypothetical protein